MTTATPAALAATLRTATLGETMTLREIAVTRETLLGFRVAGRVLSLEEAAAYVAELLARVRRALRPVAAMLSALGLHGRIEVRPQPRGRVVVRVVLNRGCALHQLARTTRWCLHQAQGALRGAGLHAGLVDDQELWVYDEALAAVDVA